MKIVSIVLLIVILLSLGMITGCQEGNMQKAENNMTKKQVVWEPTQTGFWHPKLSYSKTNQRQ